MKKNYLRLFETWYDDDIKYNKLYAKINHQFYLPIQEPKKEYVFFIDGLEVDGSVFHVFTFYYCKLTKAKNNIVTEKRLSPNYILIDDLVPSSEIGEYDDEGQEYVLCKRVVKDDEGTSVNSYVPMQVGDELIESPKRLTLMN